MGINMKRNIFENTDFLGRKTEAVKIETADNIIFRHELKYLINWKDLELIKLRYGTLLHKDINGENGNYIVRSLYFDDYWNSSYHEKLAGVYARKKYRIRIYDYNESIIQLERKKKVGNYIYKESAKLTKEEFYWIINGQYDFLLKKSTNLCKEFYIECISKFMRPKVMVDYDREAYTVSEGDVRITFDSNVRSSVLSFDIFDKYLPSFIVLEEGKLVMEVKYTQFLPNAIHELLPSDSNEFLALSKYVLCYEKTNYRTIAQSY